MGIRRILFSFCFLLVVLCHSSTAEDEATVELIKSLEKCKANGFGKTNFVCDADGLLDDETRKTVEKKLRHLRSKAECLCENREHCRIENLYEKEAALRAGVFVLNNFPPSVDSLTLSRQLYNRSGLSASATCPNGLLIVFSKQLAKAHTIRDWPSYRLNVSPFNRTISANWENGTVLVSFIPAVETHFYYSPASIQFVLGAVVAVAILLLVLALVCGLVCTLPCMNELKEVEREGELKEQFEQFEAVKLGSAPATTPIYDVPPPIAAFTEPIYVTTTAVSISEQPQSRSPSSGEQLPPALFMDPNRSVETQKKQTFLY